MSPIQTFFLEPTEMGRVVRYADDQRIVVGDCPREDFGTKLHGNHWSPLYRRTDSGEVMTWRDAPIGATMLSEFGGMDGGGSLLLKCPGEDGGGTWYVDARASNCTRRDDNSHKCWVRHGDPRQCNVTVDKSGNTCQAGGGSIIIGKWHGYLRNGQLVEA